MASFSGTWLNLHHSFLQVPFNHPLFIMYSSGTTGKPKCMVHSVGGTLIKHLQEHQIQANRNTQDVLMYYTTIGWMMWNWMVSALALGNKTLWRHLQVVVRGSGGVRFGQTFQNFHPPLGPSRRASHSGPKLLPKNSSFLKY